LYAEETFAIHYLQNDFVELSYGIFAVLLLKFRNIPLKFHKSPKRTTVKKTCSNCSNEKSRK